MVKYDSKFYGCVPFFTCQQRQLAVKIGVWWWWWWWCLGGFPMCVNSLQKSSEFTEKLLGVVISQVEEDHPEQKALV